MTGPSIKLPRGADELLQSFPAGEPDFEAQALAIEARVAAAKDAKAPSSDDWLAPPDLASEPNEPAAASRVRAGSAAPKSSFAEMARKITTAQLLSHQVGRLKDQGAMQPAQVSLAKWNNCRMALDVARDCRDMLGGSGISAEYVPIRHALNLESVITYEGTETIHQLTIGRELTGLNAF